jgi:hypothetical protein
MQSDIGNGMTGGGDMIGLLKKYPGRAATVHMKPFAAGGGSTFFDDPNCVINWDEYFGICRKEAGVRWYIVEYCRSCSVCEMVPGTRGQVKNHIIVGWFYTKNRAGMGARPYKFVRIIFRLT